MVDTPRSKSYLVGTTFADGQAPGSIRPGAIRDFVESVPALSSWSPSNPLGLSTIYVDSVNGDDAALGGSSSPFLSLARAAASLVPGSVLNLVGNSVFNETLIIAQPNVTVQKSGAGTAPRISGGVVAPAATGTWTQESTVPVFLDQETFEAGTMSAFWTTQVGAIDATRAKNGTKSWRYNATGANSNVTINVPYVEVTGWVYLDSTSTATNGQKTRIIGFESTGFNGTLGCNIWVSNISGVFHVGVGRGSSVAVDGGTIATNTWVQFRVAISTNSGNTTDFFQLYLGGVSSPSAQLTALSLSPTGGVKAEVGVFGFDTTAYIVNFDDVTVWNQPSVAALTNRWYMSGVTIDPMAVTLNGSLGTRRLAKAAITTTGSYWWDAFNSRLYVYNSANPYTAYTTIEYSQRRYPLQITAPNVTVGPIVVSHHNLDDGSIGILDHGTGSAITSTGSFNGMDVVSYTSRPGNNDSLWNRRLTGTETTTAAPAGLNALATGLAGWSSPHPSSTATFYAQLSDPSVNVLFYSPPATISANLYAATWASSGNNGTIETAILAGVADPITPLTPFGTMSRYFYQTTSRGGTGWYLPTYPLAIPAQDPGTAVARAIHIPTGAVPSLDNDSHLAVYQPSGKVMESFATIRLSDGRLVMGNWNLTDPSGPLDGSCAGMTASLCPNFAGCITDADLTATAIGHAISILLPASQITQAYVAPAAAMDRSTVYSGTLPMGSRLAIPQTVDLNAHAFESTVGAIIAHAVQDYGAILVDTGGAGLTWRNQGATSFSNVVLNTYDTATNDDLSWIVSQLVVVTGVH